jgi:hypothetical protein
MKPDDELAYDLIKDRLDQQIEAVDSFNTRAGLVLATCGVIFAAYAQLLTSRSWTSHCGLLLSILEIGALLVSGFFAFAALVPGGEEQPWRYNPDPEGLSELLKSGTTTFSQQVMDSMVKAYKHNKEIFKKKFSSLTNARIALYVSGSIFALHLLIYFSHHG